MTDTQPIRLVPPSSEPISIMPPPQYAQQQQYAAAATPIQYQYQQQAPAPSVQPPASAALPSPAPQERATKQPERIEPPANESSERAIEEMKGQINKLTEAVKYMYNQQQQRQAPASSPAPVNYYQSQPQQQMGMNGMQNAPAPAMPMMASQGAPLIGGMDMRQLIESITPIVGMYLKTKADSKVAAAAAPPIGVQQQDAMTQLINTLDVANKLKTALQSPAEAQMMTNAMNLQNNLMSNILNATAKQVIGVPTMPQHNHRVVEGQIQNVRQPVDYTQPVNHLSLK